jgi:hypothetical protein
MLKISSTRNADAYLAPAYGEFIFPPKADDAFDNLGT